MPRRREQISSAALFGLTLAIGISLTEYDKWIKFAFDGAELNFGDTVATFFVVALAMTGGRGLAAAILKMLPNSPCYHIRLSADGLIMRQLFMQQRFSWGELPRFETLQEESSTKKGTRIDHYTVVMQPMTPPPGKASGDGAYMREVLRISADEYGAKNQEQDAAELAAWLNTLSKLAGGRRLDANSSIEVPETFRSSIRPLAQS